MYVTRKKMLVEFSALARIFSIRVESDLNKLKDVAEDIEKEISLAFEFAEASESPSLEQR